MSKICKRIIALLLASCLVAAFFPFALASDEEEYVAQHRPTVWEHLIDSTGSSMRHLFNSVVGAFVGSDYCGFTDSGKHEGTEVISKKIGSDGEYIFFIRCTGCGKTFAYKGSDAQQQYNDSLHDSGLDNGISVTPASGDTPAGLIWTPVISVSDIDILGLSYASSMGSYEHHSLPYTVSEPSCIDATYSFSDSSFSTSITFTPRWGDSFYSGWRFSLSLPVSGSYSLVDQICLVNGAQSHFLSSILSPSSFSGSVGDSVVLTTVSPWSISPRTVVETFHVPSFSVFPSSSVSVPSVPSTININNNNYNVTDFNFDLRQYHVTNENNENITITYEDNRVTIHNETTDETTYNYYTIELDPGNDDPDPGSSTDPGPGDGSSSTSGGGPAGSGSDGSGCCEQCALLLRQVNQYLLQIQTLVDEINDKLGPDSDNYMQGIYNLLIEINDALDNLSDSPHDEYEQLLTSISNQLANIWGDLDDIKDTLDSVDENTATTNDKLDTVHDDLAAVLSELQTQRGILQQILSVLRDMLRHITNIDANVDEMADEESSSTFLTTVINKFGFVNQIYAINLQLFKDITNDAVTSQDVSNGVIPVGDVTPGHATSYGGSATAPQILCQFPSVTWNGVDFGGYTALDLSWYAPYKPTVDAVMSGFLWLSYIYLLFKKLPGIIHGESMSSD